MNLELYETRPAEISHMLKTTKTNISNITFVILRIHLAKSNGQNDQENKGKNLRLLDLSWDPPLI